MKKGEVLYARVYADLGSVPFVERQADEWRKQVDKIGTVRVFRRNVKVDRLDLPVQVLIVRLKPDFTLTDEFREELRVFGYAMWQQRSAT